MRLRHVHRRRERAAARRRPASPEGLAGGKVGVRGATTTEKALRHTLARLALEAKVVTVASHEDGLAQLQAGEIQAYFADQAILLYLLLASGAENLRVSDRQFTFEPYALALARGDDEFRLLVDSTLSTLYRSGAIDQIFAAAFGPKAGQSDILRALYVINGLAR